VAHPRFEWDERKRRENLRKHGIDFVEVRRAFDAPALVDYDQHHSDEEDRIGCSASSITALLSSFTPSVAGAPA
jgi:uncharacterized DUF497 family protein